MSIRCSYEDCLSVKYPCGVTTFFVLPNDQRRSIWIRNSGNRALLNLKPDAKRFFCENHFQECDIRNQFSRKTLRKTAVPLEHPSLAKNVEGDEEYEYVKIIPEMENNHTLPAELVGNSNLEQQSLHQSHYELKVLYSSPESDSPDDGTCSVPYSFLNVYNEDGNHDAPSTSRIIVQNSTDEEANTKTIENNYDSNSIELYVEDKDSNVQVDSSTVDIVNIQDHTDPGLQENDGDSEVYLPQAKKKRLNEPAAHEEKPRNETTEKTTTPTLTNASYEEDKHFALSLVGYFQRLTQKKKSLAKLKILQYLTELEIEIDSPTCL